jgi:hypothetical protein
VVGAREVGAGNPVAHRVGAYASRRVPACGLHVGGAGVSAVARPEDTAPERPTFQIRAAALVLDVHNLDAQASFWSRMLDLAVTRAEHGWVDLAPLGESGPVLSLQQVPERKQGKNRLHLDLAVVDFAGAVRRAAQLGASPVEPVYGRELDAPWQVYRDPEGNEFCLVTARRR